MLIDSPAYANRVRSIAKRVKSNNRDILKNTRSLMLATSVEVIIAAEIRRIANEFAIELEAAAAVRGEYDVDARLLVWDDVDAVNNESMESNDYD